MEEERKKLEIKQQKLDIAVLQDNLNKQMKLKEELIEKQEKLKNRRMEIITEFTEMYKEMRSQPSPYELLIDDNDGGLNAECSLKLLQKKVREVFGKEDGLLSMFKKKVALIK
ncbi:uncharacterized protein [Halyomorpha halys]|uniref:uncharacterized protein n=1 Tax=Halyomorpha halys TaxID=286706 RepID=UPI0006D4E9FF|nr:uncharacterized protein LOC106688188 [Halyomorpha halys]